jgi:m7GpppX diphosphatase
VTESAEVYAEVTKAYIASQPATSIQWVYNVLDKKSEVERLILEDPDPQVS